MKIAGLGWDERTAFEVKNKGWYAGASIVNQDGTTISLSFWDQVRLSQEISGDFSRGHAYFAERNMIILPELTEEAIRSAIKELLERGFFGC